MKIYELLDTPEKWTRRVMARDANGSIVNCRSYEACSWCLVGAAAHCYGYNEGDRVLARAAVTAGIDSDDWPSWNDDPARTYSDVIALCRHLDI